MTTVAIEKTLSPNDTGQTGGHQAGMLVPKTGSVLSFFPQLSTTVKNPRAVIDITDDAGREWRFNFIYYNNRFFGGTRDEFRLTGMTSFIRHFNLKAGDKVILHRLSPNRVLITYERADKRHKVLKLSSTWKVINANF
jgi:hypothetical protein